MLLIGFGFLHFLLTLYLFHKLIMLKQVVKYESEAEMGKVLSAVQEVVDDLAVKSKEYTDSIFAIAQEQIEDIEDKPNRVKGFKKD